MTACLRLAPAEKGSSWFEMLGSTNGPGASSAGTDSIIEVVAGVGESFRRFPSKKPVEWDGGREGRESEGEGEEG